VNDRTRRSLVFLALLTASGASCSPGYEGGRPEAKQLSGVALRAYWPEGRGPSSRTLIVEYESSLTDQQKLEEEASSVWAQLQAEAERRTIQRVALRPTVVQRGLMWRNGRPSFWRSSTTTFWRGRSAAGVWSLGDPGVRVE
jgi:hypothetical protein